MSCSRPASFVARQPFPQPARQLPTGGLSSASSDGAPHFISRWDSQYERKTEPAQIGFGRSSLSFLSLPTPSPCARPGFRFTGTAGGAATTLLLAFALALRLATLVGSTVPLTLADSGAVTTIVPVTASIAAALAAARLLSPPPQPYVLR